MMSHRGPMRWAKPWDSHAVWSQVCLGAPLYDVSLRVMASWPTREQTDLAREVTGGLLPMDQCLGLARGVDHLRVRGWFGPRV
jgi:hypothetical protein